ncbi:MAG: hypothetical protein ACRCTZ_04340 [Sarcina sp.]
MNIEEILAFIPPTTKYIYQNNQLQVDAFNNMKLASIGDFIIVDGENCYPCKPDIFMDTHNPTENAYVWTKKEYTIEAVTLWDKTLCDNISDIKQFCGSHAKFETEKGNNNSSVPSDPSLICILDTLEGDVKVYTSDAIVKGVKGEFYPVNKEKFTEIYY